MDSKLIDDVQPSTVEEHFKLIMEEEGTINLKMNDLTPDDLPVWYDEKLFKEGQKFYRRYLLSVEAASMVGLMSILAVPDTMNVLIYTEQSSTPCAAFKRYLQTKLHMYNIYTYDPNDQDSKWYKSINVIRCKHNTNNKRSINAGIGKILLRDMVITQFCFIGYVLVERKSVGLLSTTREDEAFVHLWRVVGHMLGIPDRLNMCRKTAAETRELSKKMISNVIMKYLDEAPPQYYDIVSATTKGLWHVDVTVDTDSILKFTYQLNGTEYKKEIGWYSWLNSHYYRILFNLCLVPYIGRVTQTFYSYLALFIYQHIENWPVLAWASFGKKDARINLYPKYN